MTMVAGKVLMKNRDLVELDEEKIFNDAYQLYKGVWERYNNQF